MATEHAVPYIDAASTDKLPELPATSQPEKPQPPHIQIATSEMKIDGDRGFGQRVANFAQILHTEVYLDRGFIKPEEVDLTGVYLDEYIDRSVYYLSRNGRKVAAARQIEADKKGGIMSLPTAKNFEIDPDVLADAAEVSNLADLKPHEAIEISGLASRKYTDENGKVHQGVGLDAVISLYSTMIRDSLEKGHKLWLMNTDAPLMRNLSMLIGEPQMHKLGKEQPYMGPPTIPAAINPQAVVRTILANENGEYEFQKLHLTTMLKGVDSRHIPKDIQELMKQSGIEFKEVSKLRQMFSKKELAFHGLVLAYSAARAIPAQAIPEFHGDVATLWGIDVGTSVPYSVGMARMYGGKTLKSKIAGAAIAVPSFLAPYAYLYAEGSSYPPGVNALVGAFVGVAAVKEVLTRSSRRRKNNTLRLQLQASPRSQEDRDIIDLEEFEPGPIALGEVA